MFLNLVKMTIMWTQGSFNQFLLSAQMKYLEGNIFVNFYIFGAAGVVAVLISGSTYARLGLKTSYLIAFGMSIFGTLGMVVIQMNLIHFENKQARDAFDEKLMPGLILILKMGIIMSFIITTQVSFIDDRIFPAAKRNTSVGTCGMIARSVTIVAPICNEWPAPIPILLMLAFSVVGLLTSMTFPNEDEFTPGIEQKELRYDYTKTGQKETEQDDSLSRINENPSSTAQSLFADPIEEDADLLAHAEIATDVDTAPTTSLDGAAAGQLLNKGLTLKS